MLVDPSSSIDEDDFLSIKEDFESGMYWWFLIFKDPDIFRKVIMNVDYYSEALISF